MPMYGLSHKDFQIKILYALLTFLMLENKTNFFSNFFNQCPITSICGTV